MSELIAEQLIYGRIEGEYSKIGKEGLQTLWHGPALSSVVNEIESIVRCFDARQESRLQFVRLSNRRFLVSQTRPSQGSPIVDRSGRDTFVCRCLVVSESVFRAFENHPLRLAAANPFEEDVPELMERHGPASEALGSLVLKRAQTRTATRPDFLTAELAEALLRGAVSAEKVRHIGDPIFLRGSPTAATATLHWLLDHVPARVRSWCTFTTQTDLCPVPDTLYWLMAATTSQTMRPLLGMDLDRGAILYKGELPASQAEEIFVQGISEYGYDTPARRDDIETIDAVSRLLSGESIARLPELADDILRKLLPSYPDKVAQRLEALLGAFLSRRSAVAMAQHTSKRLNDARSVQAMTLLHRGSKASDVFLGLAALWLAEDDPRLGWRERRRLARLAKEASQGELLHRFTESSKHKEIIVSVSDFVDRFKGLFTREPAPPPPPPPADERADCPFCLGKTRIGSHPTACEHCNRDLPPLYVDDHQRLPLCPVQIFGWPRHGKTVFLYAVTLMLDRMGFVWDDYTCAAVTEVCRRKLIEIRQFQTTGKMPLPTALGADEVYVMLLEDMEKWGCRTLVIRDSAGEVFDPINIDVNMAPLLLKASTTFMVISLPDLDPSDGRSMDMLMVNYLSTLIGHKGLDQPRNLVIVLSKADLLHDLPAGLRSYLLDDPLCTTVGSTGSPRLAGEEERPVFSADNLESYLGGMQRAHEAIEDWLRKTGKAMNFIRQAKRRNIHVRYTLISSTGANVGEDGLPMAWEPRRVLDPYFWALEFERKSQGI